MKKLTRVMLFIVLLCTILCTTQNVNALSDNRITIINNSSLLMDYDYAFVPITGEHVTHPMSLESSNTSNFVFRTGAERDTFNNQSPGGYTTYIIPNQTKNTNVPDQRYHYSKRWEGNERFVVRYSNVAWYGDNLVDCLLTIVPRAGEDLDPVSVNFTEYGAVAFNENFYKGLTLFDTRGAEIYFEFVYSGTRNNIGKKDMYWTWGSVNGTEGISSMDTVNNWYIIDGAQRGHVIATNFADNYGSSSPISKGLKSLERNWGGTRAYDWAIGTDTQTCSDQWGASDFYKSMVGMSVHSNNGIFGFRTLSHDFWFCPFVGPLGATAPKPTKSVKTQTSAWSNSVNAFVGDRIQYKVDQKVQNRMQGGTGYMKYNSFGYIDKLPNEVEFVSAKVIASNGGDVTSQGTLNYDRASHTVTFNFSYNYLQNGMSYAGETYSLVIDCIVDNDAREGQAFQNQPHTRINSVDLYNSAVSVTPWYKWAKITVDKDDVETGKTKQGDAVFAGAEYSIYLDEACTNLIEKIVLDENGTKTSSPFKVVEYYNGTYTYREHYYIKETKAPTGYNLDNTVHHVYVNRNNITDHAARVKEVSVTSSDEVIKNDIEIYKYLGATVSTNKQKLAGVEFTATLNSNPAKKYTATTDENGYCKLVDLPYGAYTITETVIPDKAFDGQFTVGDSTTRVKTISHNILVDKRKTTIYSYPDVTNVPKKMNITIYKEDFETGTTTQGDAHLEGAKYSTYRDEACTDKIETLTIAKNADGTYSATSGWYLVGTYYVKEDIKEYVNGTKYSYAEGYLVDENVYRVSQDPAAQTTEYTSHSITSKEAVVRNHIEIIKDIGKTSNTPQFPLDKCKFTATLISSIGTDHEFSVECTAETDRNGYCIIENLPYGRYVVQETKVSPISLRCADFTVYVQKHKTDKVNPYVPAVDGTFKAITLGEEIGTTKEYDTTYKWTDADGHIVDVPKVMQIKIRKVDEYATEEDHQYTQGDAVLEGAIYQIYRYDPRTDGYTEFVYDITVDHIDEEGYWCAESKDLLVGKYMVVEKIKESVTEEDGKTYNYSYGKGYLVDEQKYYFESKPDEQTVRITYHSDISTEQVIRGRIDAIKYNDNSVTSEKDPAVGAKLRLTLNKNKDVYYDAVVDENGYIEWVEEKSRDKYYPYTIPFGVYTISEIESSNSGENIFIYKQQTEIRHSAQTEHYIFNDEYVKLKLQIKKIDSETGKVIPGNGTFKLWDVKNQRWYQEALYPSGETITEFTTNNEGQLTINNHIEAGSYVLYEVHAPYGYYLEDTLREGNRGYEFTVGVQKDGEVAVWHEGQKDIIEPQMEKYDSVLTRVYHWTALVKDPPQKVIIKMTDLAEQFTKTQTTDTDFGTVNKPIFEKVGLKDVEFDIIAKEDVYTPEGTKRYSKGDIVSHLKTDENGKDESVELYLGDYEVVQTKVPNGYVIDTTPIDVHVEYTNEYERVQIVNLKVEQELQKTNVSFEKVFKELENCRFKFDTKYATFGIYSKQTIKNYKGNSTIGADELVDVVKTDDDFMVKNNVQLPEGNYYIKELEVSNPYKKMNDIFDFTIAYTNNNNAPIEVTINDGQVTNIADTVELEILVYPEPVYDDNEIDNIKEREELENLAHQYGIPNKLYGVFLDEECTKPVMTLDDEEATFETNEHGIIYIPDMPTGTFYFKELVAPEGYELSDEVIKAEITGTQKIVIRKAKEPMIKVAPLYKHDTFTGDGIEGITFEITDKDDNFVCYAITGKKGILKIPALYLENGEKYYYKEVSESDMYQIDDKKHEFMVGYDEDFKWSIDIIPVGNNRKTIDEVIIRKTDAETGGALEGCEFTIVLLDKNGEEYVNENGEKIYLVKNAVTNEEGEYVIKNVPYGTYKFVEIKAPEGYELDEDMTGMTFTVDKNSPDTIIFEVTNTGDIAVITLSVMLIVSIIGIIFIVLKNKMSNKNI